MASRLCPECGASLKTSKAQNVYCPNGAWMKKGGKCQWKGESKWKKKAYIPTTSIPVLSTASHEQEGIFAAFRTHDNDMVINALAGTGKTTVLIQLIRIAVERRLSVLALCFAKRDKLSLEEKACGNGKIGTANGAGYWIVSDYLKKANGKRLDLENRLSSQLLEKRWIDDGLLIPSKVPGEFGEWKTPYAIFATVVSLIDKVRAVVPLSANGKREPSENDYNEVANRFDIELPQDHRPTILFYAGWLFSQVASLRTVETYGATDYTGQIFLPVYHGMTPATRYKRVLVDEGQDQNPYGRALAMSYVDIGGKLVVVGDKHQAIYEWRGADSDSMGEWNTLIQSADIMPLTLCRRCSKTVIGIAQKIVPSIQALPDAPTGSETAIPTTQALLDLLTQERKGLVLCRTNAPLVSLVLKLIAKHIPATLMRTNLIGDLLRLIDTLSDANDDMPIVQVLAALESWAQDRLAKLAKAKNGENKAQIVVDKVAVVHAFAEQTSIQTAGQLKRKIDDVFPATGDNKPNPDTMVVGSTVHGMKGGEATTVYIFNPETLKVCLMDQVWGSARERDNVLYVAITRCKLDIFFVGKMPMLSRLSDIDGNDIGEVSETDENA